MKKLLLLLLCFAPFSISAQMERTHIVDTILEKNDPKLLELSRHQLFIDTTRTASFYDHIDNWQAKTTNIMVNNFPTHFVKINPLYDRFYLYDRCDGIDPRIEIKDSIVVFYRALEMEVAVITKVNQLAKNTVELQLLLPRSTFNKKCTLRIKKEQTGVYKLTEQYQDHKESMYMTTAKNIRNFDLVVNHCPTQKVKEYRFDHVKRK